MNLQELDDLFDDDDQEIRNIIEMQRTYTINERIDHFNNLDDDEFFRRFRFSKNTVIYILDQIIDLLGVTNQ